MPKRKKSAWRNRGDFEKDLFLSYRKSKLQKHEPFVPYGSILVSHQAKTHRPKLPKKVVETFSVLDDLMLDAIVWHHSFVMLIQSRKFKPHQTFERSLHALHMKIV